MKLLLVSAAMIAAAGLTAMAWPVQSRPPDDRAATLHAESIVIDTHIDTTSFLSHPAWRFEDRHDAPSRQRPGEGNAVDLPRMREGGLDAAFFSVYVPGTVTGPAAVKAAREQLDLLRVLVETHPRDLVLCRTAADVRAAHAEGRIGVLIGIEGGHMINNDLGTLRDFARLGARYLTLTHMVNVDWADSSGDQPKSNGLSGFGKQVVAELNKLGVLVDISHVADKTFWDALEASQAPIFASHSSCRALCGHARNLTDEMIKALARKGGVVQINFMDGYIDQANFQERARREPEYQKITADLEQRFPGPENQERRYSELRAAVAKMPPMPPVSWERIVDHIDHVVKLVGADYVGLGSDFDGASMPDGMEDCTGLPKITRELLARGYKPGDIRKILGGNMLRVMEAAERVAARTQSSPATASRRRSHLSTPVHKFGNVFRQAAGLRASACDSSLPIRAWRSSFVNRHSNGVAIAS